MLRPIVASVFDAADYDGESPVTWNRSDASAPVTRDEPVAVETGDDVVMRKTIAPFGKP